MNGETKEFFDVLYGEKAPAQQIEVRFIHPDKARPVHQHFFDSASEASEKALHPPPGYGSFVGVAPRFAKQPDALLTLWADIDSYKNGDDKEAVIERLRHDLPPTMIVDSGGGLHCYWKLDGTATPDEGRKIMRALAKKFGGDMACAEPARVLRVPGTVNSKLEGNPRPVRLISANTYKTYTVADFFEKLALTSENEEKQGVEIDVGLGYRTTQFLETGALPDDDTERTHLLGIARNLCSNDVLEEDAVEQMWAAMQKHECDRCKADDPWTEPDIARMVKSIYESDPSKEMEEFEVVLPSTGRLVPIDMGTWLSKPVEPPDFLIDDWLIQGEVVFMTGSVGIGKTWLSLDAALAVSDPERDSWLTFPVQKHGSVLYFDAESSVEMLHERLNMLGAKAERIKDSYFVFLHSGLRLDAPDWRKELFALMDETRPALVVFDSMRRFHALDENDANEMAQLYDEAFRVISQRYGAAVLIVDHPAKHGTDGSPRGSGDKLAAADRSWVVKGINGTSVTVECGKVRRGSRPPQLTVIRTVPGDRPFCMELVVERNESEDGADPKPKGRQKNITSRDALKNLLFEHDDGLTQVQIAANLNISRASVQNYLREGMAEGWVIINKDGRYAWAGPKL